MAKNPVSDHSAATHQLLIRERKQTEITGVIEICAFDETQVYLKTTCGSLRISGKDMRVTSLLPDETKALIDGTINGISYASLKSPASVFRKMLK